MPRVTPHPALFGRYRPRRCGGTEDSFHGGHIHDRPVVALGWQAGRREWPETAFVVVPLGLPAVMTVPFALTG